MKIRAKAKVRKERREAQKELESNLTPQETEIRKLGKKPKVKTIDTVELKNVITETIKRVYFDEYGIEIDDLNAREHYAHQIMFAMKYGGRGQNGYLKMDGGIPMREHEYKRIPLCKAHRR
jgi:hypothetical protein